MATERTGQRSGERSRPQGQRGKPRQNHRQNQSGGKKPAAQKPLPSARQIALDIYVDVRRKDRALDEVLAERLMDHRHLGGLDARDRGFVRSLVATAFRRHFQIDKLVNKFIKNRPAPHAVDILVLGATQLLFMDVPAHAAVGETVSLAPERFRKFVNAVLHKVNDEGRHIIASQKAEDLVLPHWLRQRWHYAWGEENAALMAAAHLKEAALDITLKPGLDLDEWAEKLDATVLPGGSLRRTAGGRVDKLPGFDDGFWWVQDIAASLPVRLLGDIAGKKIYDLCAAPGGKTMQLAAAGAEVVAVDMSEKRLRRVEDNLYRTDLRANLAVADILEWQPGNQADIVLLDAPCSATGTLRRHPDGMVLKDEKSVQKIAGMQEKLVLAAADLVKPGGSLLYCTCSLEREENESLVKRVMNGPLKDSFIRRPFAKEALPGLEDAINDAGELRCLPSFLPDAGSMDGFFAVLLEKKAD